MLHLLVGFPRSGTSWLSQCLNSLPGVRLEHEPLFQPTRPLTPALLETYAKSVPDPRPSVEALWATRALATEWARAAVPDGRTGLKEVCFGWKGQALIDGLRDADPDVRVLYLWRPFFGIAHSFVKRLRWAWVNGVFGKAEARADEDLRRIIDAAQPQENFGRLFCFWLAQVYYGTGLTEANGGLVVRLNDLAAPLDDCWAAVAEHVCDDSEARPTPKAFESFAWPGETPRTWAQITKEVQGTRFLAEPHYRRLAEAVLARAEEFERPATIRQVLGG